MKEHVIINLDRTVNVPESMKKIGIQYDHNVKTITFDCPRYPDENPSVDMSTMKIFINWMLPDKTLGSTIATNVCVDSENENLMHFDWVITRVVTSAPGVLSTLICIKETTETGEETYHWNTELIQSFKVGNGMECTEQIVEQNIDVITQLLVQMDAVNTRTSLDETLTDSTKAAPADLVGKLKSDIEQLKQSGGTSEEEIRHAVEDYLTENPINESDPTVSDWAKQPTKPKYTASEVGAIPDTTKIPENVIEDIKINGVSTAISDKTVNITIPTKTSDITNDSGFVTNIVNDLANYYLKSEVYTKEEVQSLIGRISSLELIKVDALPTENIKTSAIYLVPKDQSEENNIYTEYIYMDVKWEIIGDTSVDLSQYALKTEIPTKLSQLQNDANYSQFSGSYNDLNDKPTIVGDVKANGESIVVDGVANIPYANKTDAGVVKINYEEGITIDNSGHLKLNKATTSHITNRNLNMPITSDMYDFAVKAAMTDGVGAAWTEEEKTSGRARIGAVSSSEVTTMITDALNAIGVAEEGTY